MNYNITYQEWLEWHAEDLEWIIEMAQNGINVTPDAGNHPRNLVLHMLACDVEFIMRNRKLRETNDTKQ